MVKMDVTWTMAKRIRAPNKAHVNPKQKPEPKWGSPSLPGVSCGNNKLEKHTK